VVWCTRTGAPLRFGRVPKVESVELPGWRLDVLELLMPGTGSPIGIGMAHAVAARTAHPGRSTADLLRWLRHDPPLDELAAAFPRDWERVQREVAEVMADDDPGRVERYVSWLSRPARASDLSGKRAQETVLAAEVHRRLALALLHQVRLQVATGVTEGRVRFTLRNGWLAQRLLFDHDLVRKPVSLAWFRAVWPLVTQKRVLMPLVEPKGIYCFYSRRFVGELVKVIDGRPCVEIGAGDGTLTRFLNDAGAPVIGTDDQSWRRSITYPADVLRQDAPTAIRTHRPEVVICSFPPAGNRFERAVFRSATVQTYVVVGTRSKANTGNWRDYEEQTTFTRTESPALSRLVLPPELEPVVHVFERSRS
jgi:hypothetical protein